MKKILYIFSAILLLWGCEKNEDAYNSGQDDVLTEEVQGTELPEVLYASVVIEQDTVTRTYVGGANRDEVLWQNGDAISFFSGNIHNARYDYEGEGGTTSVELIKDETKPGTNGSLIHRSQAVYPYNENVTVVYEDGIDKINLTYPTTQKYAPNSFGKDANIMVAAGKSNEDDELYFRNACGYLVIKLYGAGTTVKSITLSSVSGLDKIVGNAVVVASNNAAPVITMADDAATAVTLDCSNGGAGVALGADAEHATEFWFCLPPVTFTDGIKITVTDMNDEAYTKQTNKTVKITRNDVQPMAALMFNTNAPAATKLWYTRADDSTDIIEFYNDDDPNFNASIKSHKWDGSKFVIEFYEPLTTIKAYAFRNTELATITLPEGVTTIEKQAFRNTPLKEITIPGSVNNIGIDAFYDCEKLSSVTFLSSATKTPLNIGYLVDVYHYGPFYDSPLTSIDLNRELVLVDGDGDEFTANEWWHGMFAHKHYKDVESVSVKLGSQVETISDYMFNYLPIESLTIPGTVKTIGNDVFNYCTKLATLTFEPSPTGEPLTIGYESENGEDENLFQDNNKLTTLNLNRELIYTFGDSYIDSSSEGLFGGMPTLTSVTLGEQVKTLQKYMFAGSGITSLDLNKVETIQDYALSGAGITELVIPGSVNTIGNNVFNGCTKLATLTFEPSLAATPLTIGYENDGESENLFQQWCKLTTLNLNRELIYTFEEDAETIDSDSEGLFGEIPTLANVTLGKQVKTLQKYMFAGSGITALEIPATVTSIAQNVFDGCSALSSITFEESAIPLHIKGQGDSFGPFYDSPLAKIVFKRPIVYTKLNDTVFTPTADELGVFAISSTAKGMVPAEAETNLTIGQNILTISNHMFCNLPIKALTIPGTVNTIGNDVFNGCDRLAELTFLPSPTLTPTPLTIGYEAEDGEDENLFQEWCPLTTLNLNRELIYTFEEAAETIDSYSEGLFGSLETLTSVTLGDQVKTLSPYMFAGTGITALEIPVTVTSIAQNVFDGCSALSSITFEESAIPLHIKGQGDSFGPFYDSPLAKIVFKRPIVYTKLNDTVFTPTADELGVFAISSTAKGMVPAEAETNLTIGQNITNIANYMFCNLPVKTLTIPEAVTTIGKGAFKGSGITNISIPANVTSIGNNAFKNCRQLVEVAFEDSATPITMGYQPGASDGWGYGPFYQSPLENIELMREVKLTIGYDYVFEKQNDADAGLFAYENRENSSATATLRIGDNVKTIHPYMFSELPITEVTIPASVTKIENDAFYGCTQLTELTFAGSTEPLTIGYDTAGDDEGLFATSQNLATVNLDRELNYTFPLDDLDDATEGIFGNHPSLASVTLGENVKTVSPFMFANTGITELEILGNVTEIKDYAFYNCTALEDLRFEYSATPLTLGFQDWSDELGPFYQSPLKYIKLDRDITYNANYAASCDGWDEGAFSNQYYESGDWIAEVIVGEQVTTLPRYMFATMRMQQLHIPESVENIGTGLVEDCKVLNAIVLYDTKERPQNVEGGAFGEFDKNSDAPGDHQYYIFVPYWRRYGAYGIYITGPYDDSYWSSLSHIMVEDKTEFEPQIKNGHESRYYDKEKGGEAGIKEGYEWYYYRYYLGTKPTE